MPLSGMLTCGSCGTRTQMGAMRYNLSGSKLICEACVDKERSSIKPGTTHATSLRLREQQMQREVAEKKQPLGGGSQNTGMAGYYCRSCHFKFSRKKDVEITTCPYCGRESVGLQYTGGAQDLIEESAEADENAF